MMLMVCFILDCNHQLPRHIETLQSSESFITRRILIRNKIIVSDKIRDFNYILEKMTEVDVMKNLMMNEYQALCLNYLQKPRDLPTSENPQRFSTIVNSEETNISQIQSYFLRLLNEDALVGHDEYLFRGLDESIKEMIFSKLNH